MGAKLFKTGNQYLLRSEANEVLAISDGTIEGKKLSLKNCQAIERGYDLDELAESFAKKHSIYPTAQDDTEYGYKAGFQKALEILGDKKFSDVNMFRMFTYGHALTNAIKLKAIEDKPFGEIFNDFIQLLQQTEWQVEFNPDELDKDGCLILKRI